MKKIDIGKNAKVNIVWNVTPTNYSREQEKSIISKFAKKYDIPSSNIRVEPNFFNKSLNDGNTCLNSENIENIQDPKFQHSLFEKYLAENNITDYDLDEILKIDSQINSLIDYNSYEKSKRYTIKWVKWSNFLSYGPNNFFDFSSLKGLVLLNGEPANESGKSTFAYDLLHYLLFGKIQSEKANVMEQLFNNYLPEATVMYVEGCINLDGCDYIIKRTLTRPDISKKNRKITSKVEYYQVFQDGTRNQLLDDENLQEESSVKTSKIIKDALGNESDFDRIISANSKDLDNLISLKETERGRLLSRWIGLSVLEDKDSIAREKWNKEISKKRYCDLYDKSSIEQNIANCNDLIDSDKKVIISEKEKIENASSKIKDYEANRNALISSRRMIDDSLLKIDVSTIEHKMSDIIVMGNNTKNKISNLTNRLNDFANITFSESDYESLAQKNESLTTELAEIRAEIKQIQKNNDDLSKAEYCPTCGRKYDNIDYSNIINSNNIKLNNLQEKEAQLTISKRNILKELEKIESDRKSLQEKSKIEINLSALNSELISQRSEYKELNHTLKEIQRNKDAIAENNKIDASLLVINETIKSEQKIISDANYSIASCQKDIENNESLITNYKSIIIHIDDERKTEKNWKLYLQMIGKNGISKIVLRNTLPIINGELNRLLNDVADFDVEISINDKNDVEFWLIRDNVKTRLSAASGLERTQASLALRVVLGKMSRLSRPPFLLLDEILGTVAKESYDSMKKLYDKIVNSYDFVLHITHLTDIVDWHDKIITIIKENNISRIK